MPNPKNPSQDNPTGPQKGPGTHAFSGALKPPEVFIDFFGAGPVASPGPMPQSSAPQTPFQEPDRLPVQDAPFETPESAHVTTGEHGPLPPFAPDLFPVKAPTPEETDFSTQSPGFEQGFEKISPSFEAEVDGTEVLPDSSELLLKGSGLDAPPLETASPTWDLSLAVPPVEEEEPSGLHEPFETAQHEIAFPTGVETHALESSSASSVEAQGFGERPSVASNFPEISHVPEPATVQESESIEYSPPSLEDMDQWFSGPSTAPAEAPPEEKPIETFLPSDSTAQVSEDTWFTSPSLAAEAMASSSEEQAIDPLSYVPPAEVDPFAMPEAQGDMTASWDSVPGVSEASYVTSQEDSPSNAMDWDTSTTDSTVSEPWGLSTDLTSEINAVFTEYTEVNTVPPPQDFELFPVVAEEPQPLEPSWETSEPEISPSPRPDNIVLFPQTAVETTPETPQDMSSLYPQEFANVSEGEEGAAPGFEAGVPETAYNLDDFNAMLAPAFGDAQPEQGRGSEIEIQQFEMGVALPGEESLPGVDEESLDTIASEPFDFEEWKTYVTEPPPSIEQASEAPEDTRWSFDGVEEPAQGFVSPPEMPQSADPFMAYDGWSDAQTLEATSPGDALWEDVAPGFDEPSEIEQSVMAFDTPFPQAPHHEHHVSPSDIHILSTDDEDSSPVSSAEQYYSPSTNFDPFFDPVPQATEWTQEEASGFDEVASSIDQDTPEQMSSDWDMWAPAPIPVASEPVDAVKISEPNLSTSNGPEFYQPAPSPSNSMQPETTQAAQTWDGITMQPLAQEVPVLMDPVAYMATKLEAALPQEMRFEQYLPEGLPSSDLPATEQGMGAYGDSSNVEPYSGVAETPEAPDPFFEPSATESDFSSDLAAFEDSAPTVIVGQEAEGLPRVEPSGLAESFDAFGLSSPPVTHMQTPTGDVLDAPQLHIAQGAPPIGAPQFASNIQVQDLVDLDVIASAPMEPHGSLYLVKYQGVCALMNQRRGEMKVLKFFQENPLATDPYNGDFRVTLEGSAAGKQMFHVCAGPWQGVVSADNTHVFIHTELTPSS